MEIFPPEKIRLLISENKTGEALDLLQSAGNNFVLLRASFVDYSNQKELGIMSAVKYRKEITRINQAILSFIDHKSGTVLPVMENNKPQQIRMPLPPGTDTGTPFIHEDLFIQNLENHLRIMQPSFTSAGDAPQVQILTAPYLAKILSPLNACQKRLGLWSDEKSSSKSALGNILIDLDAVLDDFYQTLEKCGNSEQPIGTASWLVISQSEKVSDLLAAVMSKKPGANPRQLSILLASLKIQLDRLIQLIEEKMDHYKFSKS